MIKVDITNLRTNEIGWSARFNTQVETDTWVQQGITGNWWGKPERTLSANGSGQVSDTDGSAPDLTKAISTGTTTGPLGTEVNTYTFACEYSIAQSDITDEVAAQKALQKGLQAQQVGATCVAQVYALNDAKFAAGALTGADFQALMADQTLLQIERLLWNGSLATAKMMIESYSSQYFSPQDIASVIAIIDQSGLV